MKHILSQSFFNRPAPEVAEALLGKFLVTPVGGYRITDVEAYDGFSDRASHACRGKTSRNEIMFGPAGFWYVYLVYGMHEMLNIVTGQNEYPAAVLIRGVEGIVGPGRVTKRLGITRALNTKKACHASGVWIEERGVVVSKKEIKKTPRIGIDYAGQKWSQKKWRFVLNNRITK